MNSLLCDEFPGCLPSQFKYESRRLILRIVELRNYERAVRADEEWSRSGDKNPEHAPKGPMIDLMYEIQGIKIRMAEEGIDDNR